MSQFDSIRKEVEANRALLQGCPVHEFTQPIDRRSKQPIPQPVMFCDWRCQRCGGWVDTVAKNWYERGVAHQQARIAGCFA